MASSRQRRLILFIAAPGVLAVVLLAAVAVTRLFFVNYYTARGDSRAPGLPQGQMFLINRRAYASPGQVQRGDVILYRREGTNFVQRVVALPGDEVEVDGDEWRLNGQPVEHQPAQGQGPTVYRERIGDASWNIVLDRAAPSSMVKTTVPPAQFFVMGDNRPNALDSRRLGTIGFEAIQGRKL